MTNKIKRLTDEERKQVRDLFAQGKTISEIGRLFNVSFMAVKYVVNPETAVKMKENSRKQYVEKKTQTVADIFEKKRAKLSLHIKMRNSLITQLRALDYKINEVKAFLANNNNE